MRFHFLFGALICIGISSAAGAADAVSPANPASAGSLLQVVLGLCLVVGLMAAAAWVLKRFNMSRMTSGAPVRIVGGVAVGSRERIIVVEVADQWIVVGVAPGRVNTLSTMPRQESAPYPAGAAPTAGFSAWLKQAADKRNAR